MKKIAIVTATRAEYGILIPLIHAIRNKPELELKLLVTGTHLSEKYGMTVQIIEEDSIPIAERIPILEEGNTPYDISLTMANAIRGFAKYFQKEKPDMVVILGDRTEMLGIASVAMNERIPIAHIHGGEITQGAIDDCVRHALTKMSYLHFTAMEPYRKRVIQLGEAPSRVFNVGALGVENILKMELLKETEARKRAGIPQSVKYSVVTFHPVTLENNTVNDQAIELCKAMQKRNDIFYLITGANADAGGDTVNHIFQKFAKKCNNCRFDNNLGTLLYLSVVKYADFVLGNSSSGILEAPVFGTPTVNIGDRQRGRIMPETVINCKPECNEILQAIRQADEMIHVPSLLYGKGDTSERITNIITDFLMNDKICLKKEFYDR